MKKIHKLNPTYAYFGRVEMLGRVWHFYWNGVKGHYRAEGA